MIQTLNIDIQKRIERKTQKIERQLLSKIIQTIILIFIDRKMDRKNFQIERKIDINQDNTDHNIGIHRQKDGQKERMRDRQLLTKLDNTDHNIRWIERKNERQILDSY